MEPDTDSSRLYRATQVVAALEACPVRERRPAVTDRRYSARQLPGSAWHGFSTSGALALANLCKLQEQRTLVSRRGHSTSVPCAWY